MAVYDTHATESSRTFFLRQRAESQINHMHVKGDLLISHIIIWLVSTLELSPASDSCWPPSKTYSFTSQYLISLTALQ